jgi:hypothetical protein
VLAIFFINRIVADSKASSFGQSVVDDGVITSVQSQSPDFVHNRSKETLRGATFNYDTCGENLLCCIMNIFGLAAAIPANADDGIHICASDDYRNCQPGALPHPIWCAPLRPVPANEAVLESGQSQRGAFGSLHASAQASEIPAATPWSKAPATPGRKVF